MTDPIEQARQDLQSEDQETRDRGIRRLGITPGEEACCHLLRLVEHAESSVGTRAAQMLGLHHRGPETLAALLERLRTDPSGEVRAACIFGLEEFDPAEWSSDVIAALSDSDEGVAGTACHVLSSREVRAAIGPIAELLNHPVWSVRWHSALALSGLGSDDERVSGVLERLLVDATPEVGRFQLDMIRDALEHHRAAGRHNVSDDPYLAAERDIGDPILMSGAEPLTSCAGWKDPAR